MFDQSEGQISLAPEEMWAKVCRNRWRLLLPLFLCWIVIWGISWLLPASYQSDAVILVEQQKVPEHYVVANVTQGLQERLQSLTPQILSRTRLQATIDRFHLYVSSSGLRKYLQSADPVEQMRKDIEIKPVSTQVGTLPGRSTDLTAFRISYSASSPELAQLVNNELTSLFIDESLQSQQQLSESTTTFLASQLEQARTKLDEQETKVRDFKARHLGNLPNQLQSNVEILSGLQSQLQNAQHSLDGAKQQKLYLDSQLQQLQAVQGTIGGSVSDPTSLEVLQKQLMDFRTRLADARSRYTENHPDIVELKRKTAETEKSIQEFESRSDPQDKSTGDKNPPDGPALAASGPIMQLRSQLKANELEIQNYQRQATSIGAQIASYQERLNLTPTTEQELEAISRGYEESKANYNSLLQKQNQSQLATSLEERQQGQQFHILDPPSLPDKSKSPNHLLLSLAGLGIGALLGAGLVAIRELMNPCVWRSEDLEGVIPARILVRIPHLGTPRDDRLRALTLWLELAAVLAMALVIAAGNLYAFYRG